MTRLTIPKQLWKGAGSLRSQNDVIVKVLVPFLKTLGFEQNEMEFETPFSEPFLIQIGSKKVTVKRPDILVKTGERYLLVVEAKHPDEEIAEEAIGQAVSYAVMFGANYAMVSNGQVLEVFRVRSLLDYEQQEKPPTRTEMLKAVTPVFTPTDKEEAQRSLVTFKERKEFANVFNTCHDIIRTQKGLSAKERLYEMCKILFVKLVEEDRYYKESQENRFSLRKFEEMEKSGVKPSAFMNGTLFPNANERLSDIFEKDTISLESRTIKELVGELQKYTLRQTEEDIIGMAFETFLRGTMTGRELGEFFTPRELVDFMIDIVNPNVGQTMIDPACGSGGFLIRYFKKVNKAINGMPIEKLEKEKYQEALVGDCIWGIDIDHHLVKLAQANMVLHGDGFGHLYRHNSLLGSEVEKLTRGRKFDYVITNPPFGRGKGKEITDETILQHYVLGRGRTKQSPQVLFLERCIDLLTEGGWMYTVIDDGILSNSTMGYVRRYLKDTSLIKGVISLPVGTFNPYGSGVKSSILIVQKKKDGLSQGSIYMAEARYVGYDTRRRTRYVPLDLNDLKLLGNPYNTAMSA